MKEKNQNGITLIALVITVIILIILAGVGISMISGEEGLIARANYAANLYKGAQQNEAEAINAILNNQYLSGLLNFSLSATATDTSITITGQTTGNGTVSYKYAILETAGNVDWDSITETTDISKTFTTLMDNSTALTKGTTYYVYMQAIDEKGQAQLAGNNGLAIKTCNLWNGTVNSPDLNNLPTDTTYYVTWANNTANPTENIAISQAAPSGWYDYDAGKWANIKSENTVDNTLLEAYWVWIPRYAYKLPETARGSEKMIEVMFLEDDTDYGYINGTKTLAYKATSSTISSDGTGLYSTKASTAASNWIVHPAFTFGGTELNGIWVAKFEASNPSCTATKSTGEDDNTGTTKLTVKPNVTAWRSVQLASAFTSCENAVKTGGVIGNNSSNLDLHPAKNMEWGCVAILSQSAYGIFSSGSTIPDPTDGTKMRVWNNSSSSYITGYVGSGPDASSETGAAYNSANGAKASTTGTIYGVYDMAGGSWEYVMGFLAPTGVTTITSSTVGSVGRDSTYHTNFTGKAADGTAITGSRALPDRKYYDVYAYGTLSADYSRGYIGDATSELQPASIYTWNNDYAYFVDSDSTVFSRGGRHGNGTSAGVFDFDDATGATSGYGSFRPVLVSL